MNSLYLNNVKFVERGK